MIQAMTTRPQIPGQFLVTDSGHRMIFFKYASRFIVWKTLELVWILMTLEDLLICSQDSELMMETGKRGLDVTMSVDTGESHHTRITRIN